MKFFKYWSPGTAEARAPSGVFEVRCYGGSDTSVADAAEVARDLARRAASAIEQGRAGQPGNTGYGYADRPLREEIVDEIPGPGGSGGPDAVITRNAYGSLILNTARVLFADVDDPPAPRAASGVGFLGRLLGRSAPPPPPDPHQEMLQRFHDATETEPGLGLRVYRTAGGYRCLGTSRTFDPVSEETRSLLEALGTDPLYVRLCRSQECFRARLTAKCWRCGVDPPPSRFPFSNAAEEQRYRAWENAYHARADGLAACALVASFGAPGIDEAIAPIVELHDRLACLGEDATLA